MISLNSFKLLVTTEAECVYCAVQIEYLNTVRFNFCLSESDGSSPASRRGEPQSTPGHSMWGLWWRNWHCDRFFSEYNGFPPSVLFHQCSIFVINMFLLPEENIGEVWKFSKKQCSLGNRGAMDKKALLLFSFSRGCALALLYCESCSVIRTATSR